jgi:hypothetical protein
MLNAPNFIFNAFLTYNKKPTGSTVGLIRNQRTYRKTKKPEVTPANPRFMIPNIFHDKGAIENEM